MISAVLTNHYFRQVLLTTSRLYIFPLQVKFNANTDTITLHLDIITDLVFDICELVPAPLSVYVITCPFHQVEFSKCGLLSYKLNCLVRISCK